MKPKVEELAASLRSRGVDGARLAFVLGSGLGVFADRIADAEAIPYDAIAGMPRSAVPGHAGKLVVGTIDGVKVVAQQGRVHLYEGWSALDVTRAVRAFAAIGVKGVVLTNAAGGIRPEWAPPTLMRIVDHVNLQGATALARSDASVGTPYDVEFGAALDEASRAASVALQRGVYAGLLGPTYETPAEIRFLRWLGADAVGMSTVCEASAACVAGMKVAAVSCITNLAAGITDAQLNHEEVVTVGKQASTSFCALLEAAVPRLAARAG